MSGARAGRRVFSVFVYRLFTEGGGDASSVYPFQVDSFLYRTSSSHGRNEGLMIREPVLERSGGRLGFDSDLTAVS